MELATPAGEVFHNYVIGPEQATKAILIIHDWWGVLEYNRQWANEFAKQGYRVFVIDLYDGYHPPDTKAAGEYMRSLDQEMLKRKIQTALHALHAPNRKIAILGWSFGGLQAQQSSLQYPDLIHAIVIYYCRNLLNKNNAKQIKCPVLAIFAEAEKTWPDKQAELEYAMLEAAKILEFYSYDAGHGFINPDSPRYDGEATEEAWKVTLAFLEKYLN